MIDPRLRMLQLVAHHGTVTAAARSLNYTPSAVSHQLKALSADLGVVLLESEGRSVRLTEAARTLLRHAQLLFAQAERAYAEIQEGSHSGIFTVCGFATAANYLLPHAAAGVRDAFAGLDVRVIEAEPARCINLLLTGDADLALLTGTTDLPPVSDGRFDQRPLLDDPMDLVVHKDHPLAQRNSVALADTANERWILGRPEGAYYPLTLHACQAAGFTPDAAHFADEWDTGLALVAHGFGVTLVPRMARIHHDWDVKRIELSGRAQPSRPIISFTRAGARNRPTIIKAMELIEAKAASMFTL
ncbi:LysR family transcriptional regulator [Glutamicibacter sp. NPDC087344]|uniref:LysR family transcriptional regulator n=1 Tax=Glutamicibacter sp. NPDC087344 TaxID=3363994 RepID=UPI00382CE415